MGEGVNISGSTLYIGKMVDGEFETIDTIPAIESSALSSSDRTIAIAKSTKIETPDTVENHWHGSSRRSFSHKIECNVPMTSELLDLFYPNYLIEFWKANNRGNTFQYFWYWEEVESYLDKPIIK